MQSKINSLTYLEKGDLNGVAVGSSTEHLIGTYCKNPEMKIVEISFGINTGAQLTVGNEYPVGNISTINCLPHGKINIEVNRHDGGHAMATITIYADGSILLFPLETVPSGVVLGGHVMYFYN